MHDLGFSILTRRLAYIGILGLTALAATGCGPSARDMPVVIVPGDSDVVAVLFPTCGDGYVRLVKVHGATEFARWDLPKPSGGAPSDPTIMELVFTPSGFNMADQYPAARLTSDDDEGPISTGFTQLRTLDIWTDEGEAYLRTEWLGDPSATQWVLAEIPYKDGDIKVEEVTEAEGRARLLAWCGE